MSKKKKVLLFISITLGILIIFTVISGLKIYLGAKNNPLAAFASSETTPVKTIDIPMAQTTKTVEDENISNIKIGDIIKKVEPEDSENIDLENLEEADENYSDKLETLFDPKFMENKVNVLLLGWDQSPERDIEGSALYRDDGNNFRSDAIILLVVDFETKKVDMISVPRDSYVKIYETKGKWKVNAAFAKGGAYEKDGFEYAMNTISDLMGKVPIDHYVGVNMEGLKALVDAMGGIDYDVDVKITLNGRVLEKGMQHLDGQKVLDYCRARKGIGTDINRIDRQQRVLFAIFEQMKSTGQIINIPKIYTAISDMIWTNLNLEQIASLSLFALDLNMDDLNRYTLEGQYMSAYGAQFYVLNQTAKGKLVENIFGFKPKFDKEHDISFVRSEMASRAAAMAKRQEELDAIALAEQIKNGDAVEGENDENNSVDIPIDNPIADNNIPEAEAKPTGETDSIKPEAEAKTTNEPKPDEAKSTERAVPKTDESVKPSELSE